MFIFFVNIIVLFFFEKNDMVFIKGDDFNFWVVKILIIQERLKIVRGMYYMKDEDRLGYEFYIFYGNICFVYDIILWVQFMENGKEMYLNCLYDECISKYL